MLILGPMFILTIVNLVLLAGMAKAAKGRTDDKALLDFADRDGHHNNSYPSLRAELRAHKQADERNLGC